MKKRPTLKELSEMDCPFLTADHVSGVLGSDPHTIRLTAKQRPELLGFPVVIIGTTNYARVKIPRIPFLRYMGVRGVL